MYGSLQRISIGYSHKGSLFGTLGDAWLLDSVEVFDHITGQKSKFAINQWVNKDKPRVEVAPASQEGTKVSADDVLLLLLIRYQNFSLPGAARRVAQ